MFITISTHVYVNNRIYIRRPRVHTDKNENIEHPNQILSW